MIKNLTERLHPLQDIPTNLLMWSQRIGTCFCGEVYLTELDKSIGVVAAYDFSDGQYPLDNGVSVNDFLNQKAENLAAHEFLKGVTVCVVRENKTGLALELELFFPHAGFCPAKIRGVIAYADQRMPLREPEYLSFRCCMCPSSQTPDRYTCPKGTPCRFVKCYVDERDWKYRTMGGLGETFKARYQKPDKHGDVGWKGVPYLERHDTFDAAQAELNMHAQRKGWREYHGKM